MSIEDETIQNYEARLAAASKEIDRLTMEFNKLAMENTRLSCMLLSAIRENMQLRGVTPLTPQPTELGGFKVY